MSNLNTILNKLGKIETIHETNLAKHNVELGLIDEISKDLTNAFLQQDVETEINNAVMKLQKALPIYKSIITKCDNALVKLKELGIGGGVDKKIIEQKSEAISMSKSIENRISNLNKNRK